MVVRGVSSLPSFFLAALIILLSGSVPHQAFHVRRYRSTQQRSGEFVRNVAIFDEADSERLKKAKLRLAEAQGLLPFGASEMPLSQIKDLKTFSPSSKVREISWRVAEPEVKYDPAVSSLRLFRQPARWLLRNAQIFIPIAIFIAKVLLDVLLHREEKLRALRASELLRIISSQSPALIKAGQALSSRSDLLPKDYLDALQQLQDRCPPYPNEQAFALFEEETGALSVFSLSFCMFMYLKEVLLFDTIHDNNELFILIIFLILFQEVSSKTCSTSPRCSP